MAGSVCPPCVRGSVCSAVLAGLMLVVFSPAAHAAEFHIPDGDVSALIGAIKAANDNARPDTIHLATGGVYALVDADNDTIGPNGLPAITGEVIINGNGATIERSPAAETPAFRLVHVSATGTLTAFDTTFRGGVAPDGDGGGLHNDGGVLSLVGGAVIQCTSAVRGGGIFNEGGQTTLRSVLVAGNDADRGGGLYNDLGRMELTTCTIAQNLSFIALAVYNTGDLKVTNCTLTENSAPEDDRSITLANDGGLLSLVHCTLSRNQHPALDSFNEAETSISNTIIANAFGGDCAGLVVDGGFNIIRDGSCITHPTSMSGDPLLTPLGNHGGPTPTNALRIGSIALNAGDCDEGTVRVDQRGVSRPRGSGCDIGAFELLPGDTDIDADVDLSDFAAFARCFGGPGMPPAPSCPPGVTADLDRDADVDTADFMIFAQNFTGPQ